MNSVIRKNESNEGLLLKFLASILIRQILKIIWVFPVKKNRVFCIAFSGKKYECNPKYITEYMRGNSYEFVWSCNQPIQDNSEVKTVKELSIRYLYYYCTAKVIVSNCDISAYMPKRKSQYFINTWHGGGAYKKSAVTRFSSRESYMRMSLDDYKRKSTDLVLSSSKLFSELVVPVIVRGYTGEIMPCGMPRNDFLLTADIENVKSQVHRLLGIPENNIIILYAPTYRGFFSSKHMPVDVENSIDIQGVCCAVSKRFHKSATFVFRGHPNLDGCKAMKGSVDATKYSDMQELLCAADILISDYSSSIWDYSLTKKPCFLYVPDMDSYLNDDCGTYTPIETWPGIIVQNNDELYKAILTFNEENYIQRVNRHHQVMGSYETGTASAQVCKRIAEICEL